MSIPSVSSIQFLVNYVRLCWHRRRHLSAPRLWWLWLFTILIHLLLSVSTVALPEAVLSDRAEVVIRTRRSCEWSYLAGSVVLMLVLQPGQASPFPWLRWRVRLVVRRRRLADMSLDELLALLPGGVRTIAQLVDWLTRSQTVKLLAAIPILYPILTELDVEAIIDKYGPTEAEVNIGAVILLDGNVADVSTVQANMQRLLKVLQEQGWPVKAVMVVGDRAMLSAEIVLAYHKANLKYLGAIKVMGQTEKALIRGVSEAELLAHRLDDDHYGVKCPYTFEHEDESVTNMGLVTLSRPLRRKQRRHRARKIRERLATLRLIAEERLNVRKYKRLTYAEEQINKQVLHKPGGEFIQVALDGEDGHLSLKWCINVAALKQVIPLDGKFLLVTNDRSLSGAEMVARYGEKDKVEKGFRTIKGPIKVRPVFLHKDERRFAMLRYSPGAYLPSDSPGQGAKNKLYVLYHYRTLSRHGVYVLSGLNNEPTNSVSAECAYGNFGSLSPHVR